MGHPGLNIGYDFIDSNHQNHHYQTTYRFCGRLFVNFFSGSSPRAELLCGGDRKEIGRGRQDRIFEKMRKDATAKCEAAAAERKLAGAAKNSNINKCVKDSVGEAS